ncbi:hypothetical protein CRG98_003662 [Punica granatum]|uniref:Uncharacterized protein n=1 Tax=Punica granatum TaxID=22663 RepID=A0A2I0L5G5_PUNGR|nr:hypothetical protein CRG98_003662 [Punica granatum]
MKELERIEVEKREQEEKLRRGLQVAHKICEGEENEQYAKLRDYAHELIRSNPSSNVYLHVSLESHQFERLYVCLEAYKKGFLLGCKPLIVLDGCFLKGNSGDD